VLTHLHLHPTVLRGGCMDADKNQEKERKRKRAPRPSPQKRYGEEFDVAPAHQLLIVVLKHKAKEKEREPDIQVDFSPVTRKDCIKTKQDDQDKDEIIANLEMPQIRKRHPKQGRGRDDKQPVGQSRGNSHQKAARAL